MFYDGNVFVKRESCVCVYVLEGGGRMCREGNMCVMIGEVCVLRGKVFVLIGERVCVF